MNKMICELPDGYQPLENEDYMCDKHLEFFRRLLLTWKNEVEQGVNVLTYLKEETNPGTDFGDRVTVESDLHCELRTKNREINLLNKINSALLRIENGTFGYCEVTGEKIGLKRLIARPVATMCIAAQEQHERDERTGNA